MVLLLGGLDKGGDFRGFGRRISGSVRKVVTFGRAGPKIASVLEDEVPVQRSGDLQEATRAALRSAVAGDVVLLAPACASFDSFSGFAARGEAFVKAVAEIAAETEET